MKLKHHPAFWMAIASLFTGTYATASKIVLRDFDPLFSIGFRELLVCLVIAVITWRFEHKPLTRKTTGLSLLTGVLYAATAICFILGLEKSQAINASVLGLLLPVFIYVGSLVVLHEEFIKKALIGSVISMIGGLILVAKPLLEGDTLAVNQGDGLLLLGQFFLALVFLSTKKLYNEGLASHQVLIYRNLIAGSVVLAASIFAGESLDVTGVRLSGWLALTYSVVFAGALGVLLFYGSLRYMKAEESVPFVYIPSLFGVFANAVVLGDRLDGYAIIAGIVIVAGVLVVHPIHIHAFHRVHQHQHKDNFMHRLLSRKA